LILLYNGFIGRLNDSHKGYIKKQEGKEFGLQIRLTRKDGSTENNWIKYVDTGGQVDWMLYETWKKHYKYKQ